MRCRDTKKTMACLFADLYVARQSRPKDRSPFSKLHQVGPNTDFPSSLRTLKLFEGVGQKRFASVLYTRPALQAKTGHALSEGQTRPRGGRIRVGPAGRGSPGTPANATQRAAPAPHVSLPALGRLTFCFRPTLPTSGKESPLHTSAPNLASPRGTSVPGLRCARRPQLLGAPAAGYRASPASLGPGGLGGALLACRRERRRRGSGTVSIRRPPRPAPAPSLRAAPRLLLLRLFW